MNILVTGHLGYIGPIMVKTLKSAGHFITGLDVGYFRECVIDESNEFKADREITRDIRDIEAADLHDIEAVVHLAGLSNDPLGQLEPRLTQDINFLASMKLAELAKKVGVTRFVFASSCSMYGAADNTMKPLDETAPLNPVSEYAVSKVKTEKGLSSLASSKFHPVYLRNSTAFGVSPRMRFDLVLNNLMGWAHSTGLAKVMSDGTPWRPIVHIEDISMAALAAIEAPPEAIHDEAFNIGRNDSNYQVKDIAEQVVNTVTGSSLEITGETAGDPRSYSVDFSKVASKLPGYQPQWTLKKGCNELNTWLSSKQLGNKHFESRFFVRLKQLKYLIENNVLDEDLRLRVQS